MGGLVSPRLAAELVLIVRRLSIQPTYTVIAETSRHVVASAYGSCPPSDVHAGTHVFLLLLGSAVQGHCKSPVRFARPPSTSLEWNSNDRTS